MALETISGTYLTGKESALRLGMAYATFRNHRAINGDKFLRANTGLIPGRTLFRLEDVDRLARERAA